MDLTSFFHVAIKVDDPDTAAVFYEEQLGGTIRERRRAADSDSPMAVDAVILEIADKLVYLFDEAPYEAAGYVDEQPVGFLHFGYIVDDIDAAFASVAASGVETVLEPTKYGDKRIAFFVAPGDIRIEFIEYLD